MIKPRPRDFVLTKDGLWFAVTEYQHPRGFVIAFLRYAPSGGGFLKITSVEQSYRLLEKKYPKYILDERFFGVRMQAVPLGDIKNIETPRGCLRKAFKKPDDSFKRDACYIVRLLSANSKVSLNYFGLTGSVTTGAHKKESDIDLVVYGLKNFVKVRSSIELLIKQGKFKKLSDKIIQKAYGSKGYLNIFSFEEFKHNLLRKNNSFLYKKRKIDLMCVRLEVEVKDSATRRYTKLKNNFTVHPKVIDDRLSFDFPAVYKIASKAVPKLREVVSYRNAYLGQAFRGETIEARGKLEEVKEKGKKPYLRLVVGTIRENQEYIKPLKTPCLLD